MENIFDLSNKKIIIKKIEVEMTLPSFWEDRVRAETESKKLEKLKQNLAKYQKIKVEVNDLLEISNIDKIDQTVNLRKEIEIQFSKVKKQLLDFEELCFLNGKYDQENAWLSIFAGAGGDDAQDWVEMLLRMYSKYAKQKEWDFRIVEESKGTEAGLKSVVIEVRGDFAYGFLKNEAGVHRLVRISPFDAEKTRHTSFAMVQVLPEIDDIGVVIKQDDLKVDTFLSSGPGGQHMQKTESAVRITHLPTKISASSQVARSQSKNKDRALKILKSKLYHYFQAVKQEEKDMIKGEFKSASWGNQIRSYVLHPYKMVKDLRTKFETNDVNSILDGNLNEIIESKLKFK